MRNLADTPWLDGSRRSGDTTSLLSVRSFRSLTYNYMTIRPMPAAHSSGGAESSAPSSTFDSSSAATIERLQAQLAQSHLQLAELAQRYDEISTSTAYRVGSTISRSPLGALYRLFARSKIGVSGTSAEPCATPPAASPAQGEGVLLPQLSPDMVAALEAVQAGEPVAVAHPDWLGIRSSATQMFERLLCVGDDLTPAYAQLLASRLAERRPSAIVFQGFPYTYQYLVEALYRDAGHLPLYAVWHGTFMQASEDYAWRSFRLLCALQKQGKIRRIGCVKRGQDEVLRHIGIDAGYLLNGYRQVPSGASEVLAGPVRLGIWSISELKHKPPYEMLAAASMIDDAMVVGSVASLRMREFCQEFGIAHDFVGNMVPQAQMPQYLATCHVNLYVTLNECAPMLPLESFAAGVPCIVGPNTPYFADDPYLFERLVVRVPDDAYEIAERIKGVLLERDAIMEAYRRYALRHNAAAADTITRFLA